MQPYQPRYRFHTCIFYCRMPSAVWGTPTPCGNSRFPIQYGHMRLYWRAWFKSGWIMASVRCPFWLFSGCRCFGDSGVFGCRRFWRCFGGSGVFGMWLVFGVLLRPREAAFFAGRSRLLLYQPLLLGVFRMQMFGDVDSGVSEIQMFSGWRCFRRCRCYSGYPYAPARITSCLIEPGICACIGEVWLCTLTFVGLDADALCLAYRLGGRACSFIRCLFWMIPMISGVFEMGMLFVVPRCLARHLFFFDCRDCPCICCLFWMFSKMRLLLGM